jgi:hypothetical protein
LVAHPIPAHSRDRHNPKKIGLEAALAARLVPMEARLLQPPPKQRLSLVLGDLDAPLSSPLLSPLLRQLLAHGNAK